jgi:hypothetical protein
MNKKFGLVLVILALVIGITGVVTGAVGLPAEFFLENADFTVTGEDNGDWTAYFASPAGDVNGDGLFDFLVGAPMAGNKVCPYPDPNDCPGLPKGEGRGYLVLGKPENEWPTFPMNLFDAEAAFLGCDINSMTSRQLYTAGDVNGDGYDDMLFSGWKCGGLYKGKTYLILGKPEADWGRDYDLDTASDASFLGEYDWDFSSYYTATAGDVNGDGFDDILIASTHNDEGGDDNGQIYLILGKAEADWGLDYPLANADASFIGEDPGDRIGRAIVGVGDVNNDGFEDFMIGSVSSDDGAVDAGETYLFLGRAAADWGMDFPIGSADASFVGTGPGDESGRRMAGTGDVNGDGFDDFIIGGSKNDDNGPDSGKAYLFLGNASADWGSDYSLGLADAIFVGEERRDQAGRRVSGAGDPNNDGYADFLIGAPHNSRNGEASGTAYLIYGRPAADWGTNFDLGNADVAYLGKPDIGVAGYDVAWVGDFEGDGVDDFLIAAYGGRNNDTIPGEAYLILGNDLPQIEITAPADGFTTNPANPVSFAGSASDVTDGDLTGSMVWTSDLDGVIGNGGSFDAFLSEGVHLITAAVTDSGGFLVKAQITVNALSSSPPEITILSPADRAVFSYSEEITFTGQALDNEDGDISSQIVWSSDLFGQFGVGASFGASGLGAGVHRITAEITDSSGLMRSAEIVIAIRENQPPVQLQFTPEGPEGFVEVWYKFLGLVADRDGSDDIRKAEMILEGSPGDPDGMHVLFFLDTDELFLQESGGDLWIGPCTPGDSTILSNGVVDVDCKLSTPMFLGAEFVKLRVIARWAPTITETQDFASWLRAIDLLGNDSGFRQFGNWILNPSP